MIESSVMKLRFADFSRCQNAFDSHRPERGRSVHDADSKSGRSAKFLYLGFRQT